MAAIVMITVQVAALRFGAVLVGSLLMIGAINQMRTGVTSGLSGRGTITRRDDPLYFAFMFFGRMVLGPALLLGGLYPIG